MTISIQSKKITIGKVINKEFGSDFHYFYDANVEESSLFSDNKFSFFFSGRMALYNLLS